ncbi:hypothetical protein Desti_4139 [Desulfomonile tiedjei DSM 6799]|uniref:Uncharacterized protein n=1 Tax=Desulfomonile tiedjei (strain ATCC 49306 / DSM 6799 / DCB-1) TaxID=706587 RepID=I4CB35_DESTA|nr:hypothetical protein Desti_4139 [Desulfomonile tiedjei DSM 6799]
MTRDPEGFVGVDETRRLRKKGSIDIRSNFCTVCQP